MNKNKFCRICGKELSNKNNGEVIRCDNCGNEIKSSKHKTCIECKCGNFIELDSNFCSWCGTQMKEINSSTYGKQVIEDENIELRKRLSEEREPLPSPPMAANFESSFASSNPNTVNLVAKHHLISLVSGLLFN